MPNMDDVLREKTFKEDGLDIGHRVYYTLTCADQNPDGRETAQQKQMRREQTIQRNTKAIAVIVTLLHEKGVLSEKELDELLLECAL